MYALFFNGSPRKGGNTETLLRNVMEPVSAAGWDTELIQVGGKKLPGCTACVQCFENRDMKCVLENDRFNEWMAKMVRADAIIVGSPTYFTDVSAETKALLDRAGFVAIANGGAFRGKIGAAVVAVRRAGATHVFDSINHMFLMNQMIVPGSVYWNIGIGLEKGDVKSDEEGMGNMRHLGKTIAWLGNAIKPHRDSYPMPD